MSGPSTIVSHTTAVALLLLVCSLLTGCGTIKGQTATDQLLVSDAVDRTLSQIDFRELTAQKVFLETKYLAPVKSVGFVNSEYVIGSLRELMTRDHCLLQERKEDADFVVEIRVGALGTDSHEVNYGVPGNTILNQTAGLLTSSPLMPAIPEMSFAKKSERRAAVKIAVFAYHRETHAPVWQTGTIHGLSSAKSTWVLGAGPFQKGEIYDDSELGSPPINLQDFEDQDLSPLRPIASILGSKPKETANHNRKDRFSPEAIENERLMAERPPHNAGPVVAVYETPDDSEPHAELANTTTSEETETGATESPQQPPNGDPAAAEQPGDVALSNFEE